ncbi:DUF1353 domain-containing protein [Pseudomonas nitroreducens]|uniref:DUF1353 domain-containing protein n=1 Tax=Pseudomonas nitroreducens TaxID=46680 RepID=UPI00147BA7DF|nr:DUF1353 domain-containing protein [Pseudomonas nitroreducens]NNN24398.1 DUF1353 domain-containing protein [Pseudomonas nitroreducens]
MSRFPMPLQTQLPISGERARLLANFMYQDKDNGLIQVPAGFSTDFASVKPLRTIAVALLLVSLAVGWLLPEAGAAIGTAGFYVLVLYSSVVGYGNAAATIHDWLYSTGALSRRDADRVFYNALRASHVALWRALLMYAGVRLGGHWRYRK